jgi:branched-chain amino acid transport system permease protein
VQLFLQLLFAGLALGSIYALIALGFVVIYRSSQVFNFAHGEILMLGTFIMITLLAVGVPWLLALPVAMTVTGPGGRGDRARGAAPPGGPAGVRHDHPDDLRRAGRADPGHRDLGRAGPRHALAVGEHRDHPRRRCGGHLQLGRRDRGDHAGAGAFWWLFQRSKIGVGMRATATDQEVALGLGIPVGKVFMLSWFIAGALACLAGVFLGMYPRLVDINIGFIALRAFPAVLIGGLESPLGAVIGGLSLGVLELLAQGYINPNLGTFGQNFHTVFPYVIMIAFLMVRPYGLFGQREVERV